MVEVIEERRIGVTGGDIVWAYICQLIVYTISSYCISRDDRPQYIELPVGYLEEIGSIIIVVS